MNQDPNKRLFGDIYTKYGEIGSLLLTEGLNMRAENDRETGENKGHN